MTATLFKLGTNLVHTHTLCKFTLRGNQFKRLLTIYHKLESEERTENVPDEERTLHIPVMKERIIEILNPAKGKVFVDMTFGAGGHTKAILEKEKDVKIYALDRDPTAFELARKLSQKFPQVTPMKGRFSDIGQLLVEHGLKPGSVDGFLFDTGVSSMQIDQATRGFSYRKDGPLDMRMEMDSMPGPTAADIVNFAPVDTLASILKACGEETFANSIAREIEEHRVSIGPLKTTRELAAVVTRAIESKSMKAFDSLGRRTSAAVKTFLALRVFVNNELNELYNGLQLCHQFLRPGGVAVALTFHSLEHRIVKRHFFDINMDAKIGMGSRMQIRNATGVSYRRRRAKDAPEKEAHFHGLLPEHELRDVLNNKLWAPFSKRNMLYLPSQGEIELNPRSRSAQVRAARKTNFTYYQKMQESLEATRASKCRK